MDIVTNALSSLGFDIQVAVANLINFAIIFFLLNKYIFPKIRATLEERRRIIEEGIQNATKAETRLQQVGVERADILLRAQEEAHELKVQAMKEKHKRLQEADDESQVFIARAKKLLALELEQERENDNRIFARESAQAACDAIEKIVLEKFTDTKVSQKYISDMLHVRN